MSFEQMFSYYTIDVNSHTSQSPLYLRVCIVATVHPPENISFMNNLNWDFI